MNKISTALELVDATFEGFETFTRIKAAEKHIDYLLDMCGLPHHRKKLKENMGSLSFSMTDRPYDHPRKLRVQPVVDINTDEIADESDMVECGPIQGEEFPGDFEGASPNNMPEEEPAKEMTPQKKQNKINHVPNQDASGLLTSIKGEMMKEASPAYKKYFDAMLRKFGVSSPAQLSKEQKRKFFNAVDAGWKGAREAAILALGSKTSARVMRNVKKVQQAYRSKFGKALSGGQAYRMLPDKFK